MGRSRKDLNDALVIKEQQERVQRCKNFAEYKAVQLVFLQYLTDTRGIDALDVRDTSADDDFEAACCAYFKHEL